MARLFAILVVSATCALAYADGSGTDARESKKPPIPLEEEKIAPTGLIIAGIALAAAAAVLLIGKRKKPAHKQRSELAEVHLLIEGNDRATVWTSQSALRLQTDQLGEVTLNLPIGRHDIQLQIGSVQYTRSVLVNRIERMRIPINIATEQVARTKSGDVPGEPLASAGTYQPDRKALIEDLPVPGKPPTSMARAYPDAASQGKLGEQLAGLIDVVIDSPIQPAAPVVTFSKRHPPTPPPALTLDLGEPEAGVALDDIAPPVRTGKTIPPPIAGSLLDELPMPPSKNNYELAPPQAAPVNQGPTSKVSVSDFALDDLPVGPPVKPQVELPKISAALVSDLSLDEDDVPVHRIPSRTPSNRKVPAVADFALDGVDLSSEPVAQAMPKAAVTVALADRYRKGATMGGGPLGQLFRGRDETGRRDVMIEEVPRDVTLPVPSATLAQLTHANLVTFYDHVVDNARGYLITEVVEGKQLKQQLIERGSLSALEAIGIVDQVCAGLAAAHARNVFHRCVRPACILMAGRTVKLTGFAWSPATRALLYTAPELAAGGAPDVRADLYSIGITLAELLSGAVPVGGKLELPADVPRLLAQLVRKLVSREPTIRPTSAKAVREVFSAIF